MKFAAFLVAVGIALAQPGGTPVVTNLADAKWTHEKGDPPGSESVLLREDAQTGGMELLVRFPAGHVIAPHWHSVNERVMVAEGKLSVRVGSGAETILGPGGYAYLPFTKEGAADCVRGPIAMHVLHSLGRQTGQSQGAVGAVAGRSRVFLAETQYAEETQRFRARRGSWWKGRGTRAGRFLRSDRLR